jgi:hypothetical protein
VGPENSHSAIYGFGLYTNIRPKLEIGYLQDSCNFTAATQFRMDGDFEGGVFESYGPLCASDRSFEQFNQNDII